jgi:hemerythrin superfamily protein
MLVKKRVVARKVGGAVPKDATAMLRADHKLVAGLFAEYEKSRSPTRKTALVAQICAALKAHAQLEEEIFYPAVKRALRDRELVPEAIIEHATLRSLIREVEGIAPDGEMYEAKIKVLSEYVKHNSRKSRTRCFPKRVQPGST